MVMSSKLGSLTLALSISHRSNYPSTTFTPTLPMSVSPPPSSTAKLTVRGASDGSWLVFSLSPRAARPRTRQASRCR
jgi:hypothetical protein